MLLNIICNKTLSSMCHFKIPSYGLSCLTLFTKYIFSIICQFREEINELLSLQLKGGDSNRTMWYGIRVQKHRGYLINPGLLSGLIFLSGPPPIKAVPKTDGSIAKFNIPWWKPLTLRIIWTVNSQFQQLKLYCNSHIFK